MPALDFNLIAEMVEMVVTLKNRAARDVVNTATELRNDVSGAMTLKNRAARDAITTDHIIVKATRVR